MNTLKELGISEKTESATLEIKKAAGRDGTGELPRDFFPSYSAMANTEGGTILLGIEQTGARDFHVSGIAHPERVVKSIWDGLNNRQMVNINLVVNKNIRIIQAQGKDIIQIEIPRASRRQRPVYIGTNPLTGTYRRNFEGDYLCDAATVKRMLADQLEDSRDGNILPQYSENDLDPDALKSYRQLFASLKPESPWLGDNNADFLMKIGGYARNRENNESGLTLAGLLMFGRSETIAEILPEFFLDYQERSETQLQGVRWNDRVTPDGTWSGNLFDFFKYECSANLREARSS